jgi:uncharacterized protein (TIGR02117 family)
MLTRDAGFFVKRSGRFAFRCVLALLMAVAVYAAAAVVLGLIPVNADFRQDNAAVAVYVRGNGVHTDIVVPVVNVYHDWRGEFQHLDPTTSVPFISFSWGDRGFYLETPRWRDLRASIALTAMSGLGRAVMRVEFSDPSASEYGDVVVLLSDAQYRRLVEHIRASFRRHSDDRLLAVPTPQYASGSFYFEAVGRYSLLHTCNDWARRALTAAGVRMPVWSPFYPAIFHQLRQIPVS